MQESRRPASKARIWRDILVAPAWRWLVLASLALLGAFQSIREELPSSTQRKLQLPDYVPTWPWWTWALVLCGVVIFIILLSASGIVQKLQEQAIARELELATLHEENVPLAVRFDRSEEGEEGMWWPEEAWYRFGVYNESKRRMASHVEAELVSIVPSPFRFKALPSLVTLKDGGERADINPGRRVLLDLVRRIPKPGSRQVFFWTKAVPGGLEAFLEPGQDYEAKIIVSGGNHQSPLDARFVVRLPMNEELDVYLKSVTNVE